jgi:hypothetical protein
VAEKEAPADEPLAERPQKQSKPSQSEKNEPSESKPKSALVSYPPEITLTKDTVVPLTVNGKVSGTAKMAPGKIFKVIGTDGADVLVTMADSTVRIPKEYSNFDAALDAAEALAEEKAKAPKLAASVAPATHQERSDTASSESPAVQIEKMIKTVTPLKVLEALQDFRKLGKESARDAFMRTEARKWEQVAETAKNVLRTQQADESTKRVLKNFVLTAEMFATERFDGIEGKLHEIDAGWLTIKTDLEIYGPDGPAKPEVPQEL